LPDIYAHVESSDTTIVAQEAFNSGQMLQGLIVDSGLDDLERISDLGRTR
jgi:hypothetical protein